MISQFPKDFLIICLIVVASLVFFIFGISRHQNLSQISSILPTEQIQPLPDGTLVQAQDDELVYYIEKGKKRWIESKEISRIHGFRSEDINVIPVSEINRYENGESITAQSYILLPQELDTLPDLAPLPIKDLQLKKLNNRTVLKFTASFWNQGKKHFELVASQNKETKNEESYQEVYQPIARKDGSYRNKVVGNFSWHIPHKHYHYGDFADYVFSFIRPIDNTLTISPPQTIRQKTTFCIRDNEPLSLALPGAPKKAVFPTCGQNKQGISIGWIDIYKNTLPDQYIDVNDMPAGIYSLSFFLDPNQRFAEENKNNNISTIFLNLNVKKNTAKIIAAAAPFMTTLSSFPNETLIRAGGGGKVYVTHNHKKRLLNDPAIFNSYGYSWDNIFILTQSMIDAIPFTNLARLKGAEKVYALNNLGYKRHILNPDVFYSYGFTTMDIADINQIEFASYPESNLIRQTNSDEIYLIDGTNLHSAGSFGEASKKKIGTIDTVQNLGYNLDSIHTINETDFNSYTIRPVPQ